MSTSILTAFAQSNGTGYVLRLTAELQAGGMGIACSGVKVTLAFNLAMNRAFSAVWNTLGKPGSLPSVECSFSLIKGDKALPALDGGSLYGAFSLVLMQIFTIHLYELLKKQNRQLRHPVRGYLQAIRSVDLSTVAVSAEDEPSTGDFRVVGGIDQKLKSLADLGTHVSCCVLAPGQTVPSIYSPTAIANLAAEDYLRSRNSQLPILYAQDPIDAFGQIFERQCKAAAGQIA